MTAQPTERDTAQAQEADDGLVRPHDVLRAAFADMLTAVEKGTGLTVLRGTYGS